MKAFSAFWLPVIGAVVFAIPAGAGGFAVGGGAGFGGRANALGGNPASRGASIRPLGGFPTPGHAVIPVSVIPAALITVVLATVIRAEMADRVATADPVTPTDIPSTFPTTTTDSTTEERILRPTGQLLWLRKKLTRRRSLSNRSLSISISERSLYPRRKATNPSRSLTLSRRRVT